MRARPTQATQSSTRPLTLRLVALDRASRVALSVSTADTVAWAQHVAQRHGVPVSAVLAGGKPALERDIAIALVDAAEQMAQRAMETKATPPDGDDLLRLLTKRIYDRLKARELAKRKREQAEQMAELKAMLKEQAGR
jgi:hypothetical protein